MTASLIKSRPIKSRLFALSLGSVGVVYGDIGTSPLYAFRESLAAAGRDGGLQAEMVLGVLSLVLWALLIIVTFKYVFLLLRADNRGEGGILSLMTLAQQGAQGRGWIFMLGMLGAALFYGDALITPAISVLSAVEGLKLAAPGLTPYILPISVTIILLLFIVQRSGTEKVGRFFGPIMALWFAALAWGGWLHAADSPQVWQALNPLHAFYFLTHHGMASLIALGAVFLAVTGAEALYADLGHFGKRPIRLAWLVLVMPALALNYIGQAALVLAQPEAAEQSFFLLYPQWALLPMVILATLATVIAAQAVITGAFSLTHQAIQLNMLPRLQVLYTSRDHAGQIYMPQVNWLLLAGVCMLIFMFHTSSALAAAYGIAVTGTMVITACLVFVVMRRRWNWPLLVALAVAAPLVAVDCVFLGANLTKVLEGGFMPILFSGALMVMMRSWVRGTDTLHSQARGPQNTLDFLLGELKRTPPARVDGTAVYLTSNPDYAPSALAQNLKHNNVLHAQNLLVTLRIANTAHVPQEQRLELTPINRDFTRVTLHFGFMDTPNVLQALAPLRERGMLLDLTTTTFFISRRRIVPSATFGMPLWRDHIFIYMANNASDAATYFHLPPSRVVELGVQVTV